MIHGPLQIEGVMMGRVYSHDLRQRIAKDISAGQSCRATGRKFGVSASTAIRLGAAVRDGKSLEPCKQGRPAGQGKLAPYTGFLLEAVKAKPDITLGELAGELDARHGIKVSLPAIWRVLKMAGLTYKKIAYGVRVWTRRRSRAAAGMDRPASTQDASAARTIDFHR